MNRTGEQLMDLVDVYIHSCFLPDGASMLEKRKDVIAALDAVTGDVVQPILTKELTGKTQSAQGERSASHANISAFNFGVENKHKLLVEMYRKEIATACTRKTNLTLQLTSLELQQILDALEVNRIMAKDDHGDYTREVTPKNVLDAIAILEAALL